MNVRCHLFTNSKYKHPFNMVFYLFLLVSLFYGCQMETPKSKQPTYSEIYVRYLADEMKISAECTFTKKGENGKIAKTFDNATFANYPMKARSLDEKVTRYQINLERHTLAPPYEIRYWDKEEKKPNLISLDVPKVDSFQVSEKMTKAGLVRIFGKPLSENEEISLMFTNEKNDTKEYKLGNISIEKPIIINKEQLSTLPKGKSKIYLIRTKIEENDRSKKLLQFYSNSLDTEIIE